MAREGLVWGYPTVDLHRILHNFSLDPSSPEFRAPLNAFGHDRTLADPSDRSLVAMNVDTPYSHAWLDLRAEPVVVTVPAFGEDRYVSAMFSDVYAYILGYVSPRTDGHRGATVMVAGPGWEGEVPTGVSRVIRSNSDLAVVLVRVQLMDAEDMPAVAAVQEGFAVTGLSAFTGTTPPLGTPLPASVPPVDVRGEPTPATFAALAWMMQFMPVLPEDADLRGRLAGIGVTPGAPFAPTGAAAAEVGEGIRAGARDIRERAARVRSSSEIFGTREHFAGDDLARAAGAFLGILGNSEEEYLGVGYPADADGAPFAGAHRYAITFAPDGLPPVDAFWSITLYDEDRLLYANPIARYGLGSRALPAMARDADGGVTILVQHDDPGGEMGMNWLPCPAGAFYLAFRTYLPGDAIRSGAWTAPPVRRQDPNG